MTHDVQILINDGFLLPLYYFTNGNIIYEIVHKFDG